MPIKWRLEYFDGRAIDEDEALTLNEAPRGAVRLFLVHNGTPIQRVELGGDWIPIFYRCKSAEHASIMAKPATVSNGLAFSANPVESVHRTDAVVFGKARDEGMRIDSFLFALLPNGNVVDCPKQYIAQHAIESLVENATEAVV